MANRSTHSWLRRVSFFTVLILLSFASASVQVYAEQLLEDANWFEKQLGEGVLWRYYLFDDLFDSSQSVSYIDVDLTNPNVAVHLPYLSEGWLPTSALIPKQFPSAVAGMNGTFFNRKATGGHKTYLRVNSKEVTPGSLPYAPFYLEGALVFSASRDVSIKEAPAEGWSSDTTERNIMACGPLLIVDGVIRSATLESYDTDFIRHPRSAVGLTSDHRMILLTVDGRTDPAAGMSFEELAQVMKALGCEEALNMDGGGSTTLWGAGEPQDGVLNYPSDNAKYDHGGERRCANAIAITSTR